MSAIKVWRRSPPVHHQPSSLKQLLVLVVCLNASLIPNSACMMAPLPCWFGLSHSFSLLLLIISIVPNSLDVSDIASAAVLPWHGGQTPNILDGWKRKFPVDVSILSSTCVGATIILWDGRCGGLRFAQTHVST